MNMTSDGKKITGVKALNINEESAEAIEKMVEQSNRTSPWRRFGNFGNTNLVGLPDYDFGKELTCERCGSSSVGRVSASQAECRGFEPRLPLFQLTKVYIFS